MTTNEYNALENAAIKFLNSKRFTGRYYEILQDINSLTEASELCSRQKLSYSAISHQVRFLKGIYAEEIKSIMMAYSEIIFPEFSIKNDLNALISGPYALKIWLMRYLSLKVLKCELVDLIDFELPDGSITSQYQKIDERLFSLLINVKVTNN